MPAVLCRKSAFPQAHLSVPNTITVLQNITEAFSLKVDQSVYDCINVT